jgi:hypothetical protein
MKHTALALFLALTAWGALYADKYAGEIFRMGAGIRSEALGSCGTADDRTAQPAYWNASLLTRRNGLDAEVSHSEEYDGLLTYDQVSLNLDAKFSLCVMRIGIDDVPLVRLADPSDTLSNTNRPVKYGSANNADYLVYLGFVREIGGIPVGISPKLAYRFLAKHSGYGFGADLSTHFRPMPQWLLGVRVRDFFSTQVFWENGTHETVNPGLDLDSNYRVTLPWIHRPAYLMAGAMIDTEGRDLAADVSSGALSADFHAGLDLSLHRCFDLLIGFDSDNFTAGCGIKIGRASVNYAFERDPDLENSHRVGLGWSFR